MEVLTYIEEMLVVKFGSGLGNIKNQLLAVVCVCVGHSRVGSGYLLLRHSCPHIPLNFGGTAY